MSKNKKLEDETDIRIKLSKEENEILEAFKFINGGNKKEALKSLIKKYLDYDQDVKTAYRLKRK